MDVLITETALLPATYARLLPAGPSAIAVGVATTLIVTGVAEGLARSITDTVLLSRLAT